MAIISISLHPRPKPPKWAEMAAIRPDFPQRCRMGWTHTSQRHGPSVGSAMAPAPARAPWQMGAEQGRVLGLTAMLPKLLLDWLTIKISKEITAAHWQLLQLFAPAPLVFCTCLAWIRAGSCWPHFTFPQVIYSRIILLPLRAHRRSCFLH